QSVHSGPSNSKRRWLGSLKTDPSIIRDEFSDCSEDEVPDTFLPRVMLLVVKKRRLMSLSCNKSFHFPVHKCVLQAEANVENGIGRKKDPKLFQNSIDFDEFSDISDEFEKENLSILDTLKTNGNNQFSNDREFQKLIRPSSLEGNSWMRFQSCDITLKHDPTISELY
ncbi:unnamed protein product, partial [Onchocerca flexuosa]|uniref:BTB domain-containing protein n=1 Tax=Onchocerca flexuosa TaxID=387005 RepID=A0A183HH03_9BILA